MFLLSIVIPVYNAEEYLQQCLDSIINQNNGKIEIVLIDDESKDRSSIICDDYVKKYPQFIKVIHNHNQGSLLSRREGYVFASGKYIAHVDADDYLLEDYIQNICNWLEKQPCDMLFFDYIYGAGEGKPERYIKIRKESNITLIREKNEMINQLLFGGNFNSLWIKVIRKQIVDIEKDYSRFSNVSNGDDVLQSLSLVDRAQSFLYIPKALYYYRRDNISMSKRYQLKDYASFRSVYKEMMEYVKKWELKDEKIVDLKLNMLSNNMVILHQVRKNSPKDKYNELLRTMSTDPYFLDLGDALKSKNISKYYRIIYILISKKMLLSAKLFISVIQST